MNINIPARLKELRKQSGITMLDVSNYLEIKAKTYQAYEEGRAQPSLDTWIKLKNLYGFSSIDDLLLDATEKRPPLEEAYLKASVDKRRIVDFVLNY